MRGLRRFHRLAAVVMVAGAALGAGGCSAADDSKLPPDVQDPASVKTPAGAIARYAGALSFFANSTDRIVTASGIITDELTELRSVSATAAARYAAADARLDLSVLGDADFSSMQRARAQAREARGFLAAYAPDSSPALQGHLYALEGYTDIYLADLFCSGIPLSTVNFDGSYTLASGSTTAQVYERAVALFDSALALSADSATFQSAAAVGKGRALLALGRYAEAAAAVAAVPDDYVMKVAFRFAPPDSAFPTNTPVPTAPSWSALWYFGWWASTQPGTPLEVMGVANLEGGHGLDYRTSQDPRSAVVAVGAVASGDSMYFPAKYLQGHFDGFSVAASGVDTFRIASGVEARLIQAEASLQANPEGGEWLATLNHLRQTAWPLIVPAPSGPLTDLTDPGTAKGRIDLLFRERAFWLFLTGHRQGDLRRLVRQYGNMAGYQPDDVYPSGSFSGGGGTTSYGHEIVAPVPISEQQLNPKYTGCVSSNA